MFKVGDLVTSEKLGNGVVIDIDTENEGIIFPIKVKFSDGEIQTYSKTGTYFIDAKGKGVRNIKKINSLKHLIEKGVE